MAETDSALVPRAYQLELFEESMRQNLIIAMETGSGKTLVAKLRIEAELERCSPDKLVWFLTPTKILAEQQYSKLRDQLPAYPSRLITGSDNVEYWSSEVWRAIMPKTRLIVSTAQILFDAVSHGYVSFGSIALLVFDEAHHCTLRHPYNRIMGEFYHSPPGENPHEQRPYIMGLTASPITSGKKGLLEKLESNLNAVCRAPSKHMTELQQHVNRPVLSQLTYDDSYILPSSYLLKLDSAITDVDLSADPLVRSLDPREQTNFMMSKKPLHIQDQLETLLRRSIELHQQLGHWGSSFFMRGYLTNLQNKVARWKGYDFSMASGLPQGQEIMYLHRLLSIVLNSSSNAQMGHSLDISPKAEALLQFLADFPRTDTRAIIFVKERSTAAALSKLISEHPLTRDLHSAAPIVGTSDGQGRKATFDMIEKADQLNGLSEFRNGLKNVLVGTSVTEEGIDIPSANLVIRFDEPANFLAFVQSRGRARHSKSRFVWMNGKYHNRDQYEQWLKTEAEMKEIYQDTDRSATDQDEVDLAELNYEEFLMSKNKSAQISIHDAKQHLEHFCATLPKIPYVEAGRPEYRFESPQVEFYRADVVLPQSISIDNHRIKGIHTWRSRKMAAKDAALRAYTALQEAGFLNDHLLPAELPDPVGVEFDISDQCVSLVCIQARLQPWVEVSDEDTLLKVDIQWHDQIDYPPLYIKVSWRVEDDQSLELHWTSEAKIRLRISPSESIVQTGLRSQTLEVVGRDCTQLLFNSVLLGGDRIRRQLSESPLTVLPSPKSSDLTTWIEHLKQFSEQDTGSLRQGQTLLRVKGQTRHRRPFIYLSTVLRFRDNERFSDASGVLRSDRPEPHYEVKPVPNRLDYLTPMDSKFNTTLDCIPATNMEIDPLPVSYAQMTILVPTILHRLEIREVAASLRRDILAPIGLESLDLIETAICAPSAHCGFDYNQLEFLGDTILKLWTSSHLVARFPKYHEGYLSKAKHKIVSNAHLFRQAIAHGLDRYVHTEAFASSRWKPPVARQLNGANDMIVEREVSSKLLGDVVEALLGASFLDSTEEADKTLKVKACLQLLLDNIPWKTPAEDARVLKSLAPDRAVNFSHHDSLREFTGYTFEKHSLLKEAVTNPSHLLAGQGDYQRLEFLGDAVLEFLVVEKIGFQQKLSHVDMHLAKESVVNAHLLAFLCLGASVEGERVEVKTKAGSKQSIKVYKAQKLTRLWEFMRHCGSPDLLDAQSTCVERYELLRETIQTRLEKGNEYPWYELLSLGAPKFFSDLIESLLGAIFVDSGGQMTPCREFLRRLGLFTILDRVVKKELGALHPKGRLGIVSGSSTIVYIAGQEVGKEGIRHTCKVVLDGEEIAACLGQISKAAAEVRVAEMATRVVLERERVEGIRMEVDVEACSSGI